MTYTHLNKALLLFASVGVAACATYPIYAQNDDELLNFISAQQEAARKRIKSYHIMATQEGVFENYAIAPGKMVSFSSEFETIVRGREVWAHETKLQTDGFTGETIEVESSGVMNENYIAFWPLHEGNRAYIFDHNSIDDASGQAKRRIRGTVPYDYLQVGFTLGASKLSLRQLREMQASYSRWTVETIVDSDGNENYLIRRYLINEVYDPNVPDLEAIVDPGRDYLYRLVVARTPKGLVRIVERIDVEQSQAGSWFPTRYEKWVFEKDKAVAVDIKLFLTDAYRDILEKADVRSKSVSTVSEVALNSQIDDSQFDWRALDFRPRTMQVFWTDVDGNSEIMRVEDDNLVPEV